jgi:hypothetical protein
MRHTEFWVRINAALGTNYAEHWAAHHVLSDLGGRTAEQALNAGESPRRVWLVVHEALDLPANTR